MSDVSKTSELIAEARRQVGHIEDMSKRERLISDLADALSARQPTEDDREAIAKALCEGADTCWNDLTEQELVWHYRDAESVLAAGFSRATVPDAALAEAKKQLGEIQRHFTAIAGSGEIRVYEDTGEKHGIDYQSSVWAKRGERMTRDLIEFLGEHHRPEPVGNGESK